MLNKTHMKPLWKGLRQRTTSYHSSSLPKRTGSGSNLQSLVQTSFGSPTQSPLITIKDRKGTDKVCLCLCL